ncbi:hypothetical protein [Pyruvatibacter sp.]|uniref:hypothetical protein n=1 Tax=Pyruvatibacter sp. TaxID=1981328 RepID=UPI0032EE9C87
MKKVLIALFIVGVLAAGGLAALLLTPAGKNLLGNVAASGAGQNLQNYLAKQIVKVANTYIVPEIEFQKLTYQQPGTIILDGVTFTAPDSTEVITCKSITVTLAEVPRIGEPLVFEAIVLDTPDLRLIRTTGADGESGFKGLVPFAKTKNIKNQEDQPEDTRLSNVFSIRELKIVNGIIEMREEGDEEAMELTDLNMTLNATPDDAGEPGWYKLDTVVGRKPVFELDLKGRINIDTFVAELDETTLETHLHEDNYSSLPVALQNALRQYKAKGDLKATLSGRLPLTDWKASDLEIDGALDDFNLTFTKIEVPIKKAQFDARLAQGIATLPTFDINALNGSIAVTDASVDLNATDMPMSASWTITDVDLDKFFRAQATDANLPKLKGILNTSGGVRASAANLPASVEGSGDLKIRNGQLIAIPVLTDLADLLDVVGQITGNAYEPQDKLDVDFKLTGKGVDLSSFVAETKAVVARGKGLISYERTLDLTVNAGPMEKVQNMLGKVGDVLGAVTDKLVKYSVTGPVGDPKVGVKPLGL